MKLLTAQPGTSRFQWELEVLLTNLRQLDGFDLEVVLLFTDRNWTVPEFFRKNYPEASVHVYDDTRSNRRYIPTVRPFLWQQYLKEDPAREQEGYLYTDSDIIFREWLDLSQIDPHEDVWSASECLQKGGKGYVDYEYIVGCKNGEAIAEKMAEICGITMDQLKAAPSVGAQWVMRRPTLDYWIRVQRDCDELYGYLNSVQSDIQSWTTDMWAHLFGAIRAGKKVATCKEMDFCVSTDPVEKYDTVKILHNAGVQPSMASDHFFKGAYKDKSPLGLDFSNVRTDKCTIKYVDAIKKVIH